MITLRVIEILRTFSLSSHLGVSAAPALTSSSQHNPRHGCVTLVLEPPLLAAV